MKRQIELAGVKKIRVHDLRHSHVAYLIEKGVEPLLIRDRLGHKDIRITLNTYGHLYPNQQRKIANLLDNENDSMGWEKKRKVNVEDAKEKAQINNLSKFSDNQIH